MQTRVHKEGSESDQFWELLGGKKKHPAQKIPREAESDPHLFSCTLSKGSSNIYFSFQMTTEYIKSL